MSETKTLRPVLHVGKPPTSPPPAKLLINHGKPNFTIQRTSKTKANQAKKPINKQQNDNELSRVHQKISGSTIRQRSPPTPTQTNGISHFAEVKLKPVAVPNNIVHIQLKSPKAQSYGTIERNRIMTIRDYNHADNQTMTNGAAEIQKEKPIKPEIKAKPANLLNRIFEMNDNRQLNSTKISTTKQPPAPTNIRNGNFEQKTVVSFARDLQEGPNKYPDTVKVVKPSVDFAPNEFVKEFSKLKFEILGNGEAVIPVVKDDKYI